MASVDAAGPAPGQPTHTAAITTAASFVGPTSLPLAVADAIQVGARAGEELPVAGRERGAEDLSRPGTERVLRDELHRRARLQDERLARLAQEVDPAPGRD